MALFLTYNPAGVADEGLAIFTSLSSGDKWVMGTSRSGYVYRANGPIILRGVTHYTCSDDDLEFGTRAVKADHE